MQIQMQMQMHEILQETLKKVIENHDTYDISDPLYCSIYYACKYFPDEIEKYDIYLNECDFPEISDDISPFVTAANIMARELNLEYEITSRWTDMKTEDVGTHPPIIEETDPASVLAHMEHHINDL